MGAFNRIRNALTGCLEIYLFMKRGVTRFGSDISSMKWSFLVPLMVWPMGIPFLPMNQAYEGQITPTLIIDYAMRPTLTMALVILAMWAMCRGLKKNELLPHWITVMNWMNIPSIVLMMPILVMVLSGRTEWSQAYPAFVIIVLYGKASVAFATTYILRVPWQIGGGFALGIVVVEDFVAGVIRLLH